MFFQYRNPFVLYNFAHHFSAIPWTWYFEHRRSWPWQKGQKQQHQYLQRNNRSLQLDNGVKMQHERDRSHSVAVRHRHYKMDIEKWIEDHLEGEGCAPHSYSYCGARARASPQSSATWVRGGWPPHPSTLTGKSILCRHNRVRFSLCILWMLFSGF